MIYSYNIEVPRGRYNSPCLLPDNACSDTNTACQQGLCLCAKEHFRRDGVCGKYGFFYLVQFANNLFNTKYALQHTTLNSAATYIKIPE